jgi:hypothetical protein
MRRLSNAASLTACMGLLLIWLQYTFALQTAMAGLFVFGVGCGIRVAVRIMRMHGGAAHGDGPAVGS